MAKVEPNLGQSRVSSDYAQRMYNVRAFVDGLGIGAGVISVFVSILFADLLGLPRSYMVAVSAILAGVCTGDIVSLYLRGKLSLGTTAAITFSHDGRGGFSDSDIRALQEGLANLTAAREDTNDPQSVNSRHLRQSRDVIAQAKTRLLENASQIDKRSRVSLVTGSAISAIAVITLLAFAFPPIPLSMLTWQQLLSTYLPKLGVIVMLEVFALFFLRLYKASLAESRSVHADLNALSLKETALLSAWTEVDEQRLQLAMSLVRPASEDLRSTEDPISSVDPKVLADLVASVTKLARG